ncbi:16S rRNA (adenine(1518)-N(6)/adenine(1519)-N(6))-dimethyltransferase RsmA [Sunxiuqinia dokdonensis]|uniref:Ribosomal RNA small subunit methyltransferase A n=1 Tax=Sunxiuqinia dokdonensis TaxID=1409788 RepID=A0A0L8VEK2_9BACT|nr:16S rRNA (adenine(1518)-N(6)/adenine(1519)-N(6))-dimethyltransferase RsmA [Sunxiuqinia dokdonensis]KOH46602.1 16S rRNA methyltransferase [Sunxiuqinia dokdonensis]
MTNVRAKKNLGQHFLTDKNIALKIVDSLQAEGVNHVLEVGPGMGVLTRFLLQKENYKTTVVEIDRESVAYLKVHFPQLEDRILSRDFLRMNLNEYFSGPFAIIGNFPYNISSQIFFKVLEYRDQIPEVVGMLQKEVAERLATGPGSKTYGILSVFLQAFYDIEYLFTVHENVFNPPPKVKSGVIRLRRNQTKTLNCNEKLFFQLVKAGFNQRRKMLRSSVKSFIRDEELKQDPIFSKRPEQLSVNDFERLTRLIESQS